MGKFTRQELEEALQIYNEAHQEASETGDWATWAEIFTEDATYIEHAYGEFHGRQAIKEWITAVMAPFPHMTFAHAWYCIDEENDAFIFCAPNVVPHPTDPNKKFSFDSWSRVIYAGNGKFSSHEDIYNPIRAAEALGEWIAAGGRLECQPKIQAKWGPPLQ